MDDRPRRSASAAGAALTWALTSCLALCLPVEAHALRSVIPCGRMSDADIVIIGHVLSDTTYPSGESWHGRRIIRTDYETAVDEVWRSPWPVGPTLTIRVECVEAIEDDSIRPGRERELIYLRTPPGSDGRWHEMMCDPPLVDRESIHGIPLPLYRTILEDLGHMRDRYASFRRSGKRDSIPPGHGLLKWKIVPPPSLHDLSGFVHVPDLHLAYSLPTFNTLTLVPLPVGFHRLVFYDERCRPRAVRVRIHEGRVDSVKVVLKLRPRPPLD